MIKKSIALMVIFTMLGLLLACAGVAEVSPTIVVTPASAPGKTPITITGAGFVPGEEVEVSITVPGPHGDTKHVLGGYNTGAALNPVANAEGAFSIASKIPNPNYCPPGVYTITAKGNKGSLAISPMGVLEIPKK